MSWSTPRSSACTGCGSGAPTGNDGGKIRLDAVLPDGAADALDLFDRMQLEAVIGVCRESDSLSEAGRKLYDRSRTQRTVVNDADRLRKYLLKFGLNWESVSGREG